MNKTISEILKECEVNDRLISGDMTWIVVEKYKEDSELLVVARPEQENGFELWSCGVESHSYMPDLCKI
jgi:hypothetical protein